MYETFNGSNAYSINYNYAINNSIIITHYEKVLIILNNVKQYINSTSKLQSKLIKNLNWVIKVISSHSLYSYELKDKDLISKLSKQNSDFKNFVDFVSKYNEQVINMNKKNIKLGVKTIEVTNELLQKPSIKLKKIINLNRNKSVSIPKEYSIKKSNGNKLEKANEKNESNTPSNLKMKKYSMTIGDNEIKKLHINGINTTYNNMKYPYTKNRNLKNLKYEEKKIPNLIGRTKTYFIDIDKYNIKKNKRKISLNNKMVNNEIFFIYKNMKEDKKIENLNKSFLNFSLNKLDFLLNESNFNLKSILEKDFNIFELEKIVGHKNVLPIMGRVMLDSFGLINEKIMPIDKLNSFLKSVTNQYLISTLYHNSIHGADITQTICLFFNYSNAEKISHTKALDLLSIIISALGHDIGHPGLTNNFHINSLSELAITYNDSSCLENFHLATLFKTLRKDETNIFENLSVQDFKKIRKKMISEILATDMAIHGKIINNIRSKIPEYLMQEKNNSNSNNIQKFELITDINNEETTDEEKQALLDYFIHAADLGHNTKLFQISLRWVELLSEEFWLQGDKEKKMNLSISFLCDRENTDVPKSQVGFIGGFILPTFQYLVIMFPSLKFTVDNAKNNIKEWQKLVEQNRKKGWTPPKKIKEEEEKTNKKERNIKNKKETVFIDIKIE